MEISLLSLLLTSLALLTQSKLPKNQLPTSFGLRYDDHLQSSVIDSLNLSDPTTLNSHFAIVMSLMRGINVPDYVCKRVSKDCEG